jgi:hypothetical protein
VGLTNTLTCRFSLSFLISFFDSSVSMDFPVEAIIVARTRERPSSPSGAPVKRMAYLSGAMRRVGERWTLYFLAASPPISWNSAFIFPSIFASSFTRPVTMELNWSFEPFLVKGRNLTSSFR